MGMYGADVAGLRSLAESFERGSTDLETTRGLLSEAIEGSRWQGADAAEMRGGWTSMADRALAQACRVLADYATVLRRDADEQESASGGAAGATGGGATGGTTAPSTADGGPGGRGPDAGAQAAARAVDHLIPGEGDALDAVGDTTHAFENGGGSVTIDEGGIEGEIKLPGDAHVGLSQDGVEVGGKISGPGVESPVEGVLALESGVEVVGSVKNDDGFDVYKLSADASSTLKTDVSLWRVDAEASATGGGRFDFEVRVPEGTAFDPSTIDPFAPETYPPGTRITLNGEAYRSDELSFGYDLLRSESSSEEATGVTTTVEWLEGDTVRITTGDTESMSLTEKFGIGTGDDWSAMVGRSNELSSAELGEATLDLSSDAGRAAYDRFLVTGELPADPADGVSGTTTYSTYDFSSGSSVELKTPLLEYVHDKVSSSGSGVTILNPDGTSDHHGQVALSGGVERNYSHHLGTDGEIVPSRSTDAYVFRATESTDSWVNNPNLALGDGTSAAPGSTVRITFTPTQMAELRDLAASQATPGSGTISQLVYEGDAFTPGGPTVRTPTEFADALYGTTGGGTGTGAGGDVMLERVSTIMSRAGTDEFPGTVEIVQK